MFKIGDRVICVKRSRYCTDEIIGKTGEVIDVNEYPSLDVVGVKFDIELMDWNTVGREYNCRYNKFVEMESLQKINGGS